MIAIFGSPIDEAHQSLADRHEADQLHEVINGCFQVRHPPRRHGIQDQTSHGKATGKITGGSHQQTHGGKDEEIGHQKPWLIRDRSQTERTLEANESNDVRYFQEALDMIEEFQRRGPNRGTTEVNFVERQK